MKNKTYIPALVAVTTLTVSSIHAATLWTGATDSDFGINSNWNNSAPGQVDVDQLATINNGDTVNVTNDYTAPNTYRLEIQGNSTVNVSAAMTVNRLTDIGAGSSLNLLDGSAFTMPKISSGNNSGWFIDGTLEISGGTHAFNERLFGSGTIRMIGDEASFNINQIGGSGQDYEFIFNSTGVTGVIGGGTGIGGSGAGPYMVLGGSTLFVDGTDYTGPYDAAGTTFTLFDSNNITSAFSLVDIDVVGFGQEGNTDYGYTLTQDLGTDDVFITVFVPEPSSTALLGLGGLVLAFRRKR